MAWPFLPDKRVCLLLQLHHTILKKTRWGAKVDTANPCSSFLWHIGMQHVRTSRNNCIAYMVRAQCNVVYPKRVHSEWNVCLIYLWDKRKCVCACLWIQQLEVTPPLLPHAHVIVASQTFLYILQYQCIRITQGTVRAAGNYITFFSFFFVDHGDSYSYE